MDDVELSKEAPATGFKPLWPRLFFLFLAFLASNLVAVGPIQQRVERPALGLQQRVLNSKASWLVLGDSHAAALPYSSREALELAEGGDSFAEMRVKFRFAMKAGVPLRAVVVPVDLNGFSADRERRNNYQKGVFWCSPSSFQDVYQGSRLQFWKATVLYRRLPLLNPVNARLSRRFVLHRLGWVPNEGSQWSGLSPSERRQRALARFRQNLGSGFSQQQAEQFRLLLADLREHKLQILGVRYPVSNEYKALSEGISWKGQVEEILKSEGLRVLDFESRAQQAEMRDQDHILRASATANELVAEVHQALEL